MGMYGYTYLGYYIIGKEREVGSTAPKKVCVNDHDHRLASGSFCPECGGMVVTIDVPITVTPSFEDIPESELGEDEDMYDQLMRPGYASPDGYAVLISNYDVNAIEFDDNDDNGITDITDALREEQYKAFMEKHERHIELLRKYVYDDVEVKYGIFRYYM
jgi:hypothetical protein